MWVSNRLIMIFFLKPWQQQGYLHDKKKKKRITKKIVQLTKSYIRHLRLLQDKNSKIHSGDIFMYISKTFL